MQPNDETAGTPALEYSVPVQARQLLQDGIVRNPLVVPNIPKEAEEYLSRIQFEGSESPSLPINWRFAESVSALKGLEAIMVCALLKRKHGVDVGEVVINTDHAQLFFMSAFLWTIDPDGEKLSGMSPDDVEKVLKYFPSNNIHRHQATPYRAACTNIYKTKDDKYFHLHASMNPDPTLESIGLPPDMDADTPEAAMQPYIATISQLDSADMQRRADTARQAGTICWTADEFRRSPHGRANAQVGLFEIHAHDQHKQPACWWPSSPQTAPERPLAGLKVVDLTRVIAAPAITRGLAELGASVMRVTAGHLVDMSALHCDLNWGKWNCHLDLREEGDRERLRGLIGEADVVVSGYRPYVLDKWGFGEEDVLEMCKGRERGVVYVRENCYGWQGEWAGRSGWQQISDACCGVSMEYGRAMGNDEPVTPVFPNSDYCTGILGLAGIIQALLLRAEKGGSYTVDVALNYYSQWLVNSCGVYPEAVWNEVWGRYGKPVFRHYHAMGHTLPRFARMLQSQRKDVLFRDEFFEVRDCKNRGVKIRAVKPILKFPGGEVTLGYNVGTRPNGVDQPRWPEDLMTEVVT